MPTNISWAAETWNPVTGCTKISEGCENCYAERMSKRLAGRCGYSKDNPFSVTFHDDKLDQPYRWKKDRMIFVCSMGDLFHDEVFSEKYVVDGKYNRILDQIFSVFLACQLFKNYHHTFLLLTKRPENLRRYLKSRTSKEHLQAWAKMCWAHCDDEDISVLDCVESAVCHDWDKSGRNSFGSPLVPWGYCHQLFPLPNLWIGVTAENQQLAEERIPILLQTPAAKRFVSCEPLLGPIELSGGFTYPDGDSVKGGSLTRGHLSPPYDSQTLDWVICGGETGPHARPTHPDWVRSLRDQCISADVPFHFKSWGAWCHVDQMQDADRKIVGRLIDGVVWDEFPEDGDSDA